MVKVKAVETFVMTGNPSPEFQNYNLSQTEGTDLPRDQDLRVSIWYQHNRANNFWVIQEEKA